MAPTDPYEGLNNEATPPSGFSMQLEVPEYLKAASAHPAASYNQATNTLTMRGYMGDAFHNSQAIPTTAPSTGDRPWTQDAGYLAMAPDKQKEFDTLMDEMEGYQKQSAAAGFGSIWESQGASGGQDYWESWYPKYTELEDKWSWMVPTSQKRDATGALNSYQTLQGKYYYLQPGQYAKTTDMDGKDIYYYKDPSGLQAGLLQSDTPPKGLYDVEMADLYGVSESTANPKTAWDELASTYKYSELPGLGSLSTDIQNQVSPYLTQMNDIQTNISELQNLRPEERAARESETGISLTKYLSNLQDVQKNIANALSGTSLSTPQFNPVTGQKIGESELDYAKQNEDYREFQDMLAMPYMTNPTSGQQNNSMALDILGNLFGYPNILQPTSRRDPMAGFGKNWWWAGQNRPAPPNLPTPPTSAGCPEEQLGGCPTYANNCTLDNWGCIDHYQCSWVKYDQPMCPQDTGQACKADQGCQGGGYTINCPTDDYSNCRDYSMCSWTAAYAQPVCPQDTGQACKADQGCPEDQLRRCLGDLACPGNWTCSWDTEMCRMDISCRMQGECMQAYNCRDYGMCSWTKYDQPICQQDKGQPKCKLDMMVPYTCGQGYTINCPTDDYSNCRDYSMCSWTAAYAQPVCPQDNAGCGQGYSGCPQYDWSV